MARSGARSSPAWRRCGSPPSAWWPSSRRACLRRTRSSSSRTRGSTTRSSSGRPPSAACRRALARLLVFLDDLRWCTYGIIVGALLAQQFGKAALLHLQLKPKACSRPAEPPQIIQGPPRFADRLDLAARHVNRLARSASATRRARWTTSRRASCTAWAGSAMF